MRLMRAKLGLLAPHESDGALVESLLHTMQATAADWTNSFRALADVCDGTADPRALISRLVSYCAAPEQLARAAMQRARTAAPQMPMPQLMQVERIAA